MTLTERIDYLITITSGGMADICTTPERWEARKRNMHEFAELLLADPADMVQPDMTKRAKLKIVREEPVTLANFGPNGPAHWSSAADLQKAIDSPSIQMPQGLAKEEMRSFIVSHAEPGSAPVADCGPNPVTWTDADRVRLSASLGKMYGRDDLPTDEWAFNVNTAESLAAAQGSMEDFGEAADLVDAIRECATNGDALGLVLSYRHKIRAALPWSAQGGDASGGKNE